MEYRKPHEIANQLHEARLELRASSNLSLETALIERIAELPEDDFCHFARETMQMGAGYAYQKRFDSTTSLADVFETFFATQPQNRYRSPDEVKLERDLTAYAALQFADNGRMPTLVHSIDPYQVEAAAAFAEGYMITSSFMHSESNTFEVA